MLVSNKISIDYGFITHFNLPGYFLTIDYCCQKQQFLLLCQVKLIKIQIRIYSEIFGQYNRLPGYYTRRVFKISVEIVKLRGELHYQKEAKPLGF